MSSLRSYDSISSSVSPVQGPDAGGLKAGVRLKRRLRATKMAAAATTAAITTTTPQAARSLGEKEAETVWGESTDREMVALEPDSEDLHPAKE